MESYYCHRDYFDSFEIGKSYKGEKVIIKDVSDLKSIPTLYIRVYIDDISYRYFNPFYESAFPKLSDYFMSVEEWRNYQISEIVL